MTSLKEISEKTGFSISVVSRVLNPAPDKNARVSKKTRALIHQAAEELGFRRNRMAEFLRKGQMATIGVFLPKKPNRLIADLIIGMSEVAKGQDFPLSLHFGHSLEDYREFIRTTSSVSNSGIITYPPQADHYNQAMDELSDYVKQGVKTVLLNPAPFCDIEGIPTISIDDYHGGRIAAEHLLTRKCETFAFVYSRKQRFRRRETGFLELLESRQFPCRDICADNRELEAFLQEVQKEGDLPAGVFATSDKKALQVMRQCRRLGLKLGRDILLIGYDDLFLTDCVDPPLTTVHQPFHAEGTLAVKKIIQLIYGSYVESERIKPTLVVRQTA